MPVVPLPDRALIHVSGPDALDFLQNIVTADLSLLGADEAKPSALLSPQGKILFDFLVSHAGDQTLRLDIRADVADDFVRRLTLYRLRAKVQIAKLDQGLVVVRFNSDSAASQTESTASDADSGWLRDSRFPQGGAWRRYGVAVAADASLDAWNAFRIAHGVAESGADYALGDAFPHDVLLDQYGGVGFRKGCYIGQEVVSRMQHRGTARRRVLIAGGDGPLPSAGAEIMAGERAVGTLGNGVGNAALAIARLDRVKDAIDAGTPLTAAGTRLTLAIPAFASFGFPEAATADEG
ncbi:MAG: folate-binding protein YgfZ [Rhizobiaceae bacterium]